MYDSGERTVDIRSRAFLAKSLMGETVVAHAAMRLEPEYALAWDTLASLFGETGVALRPHAASSQPANTDQIA